MEDRYGILLGLKDTFISILRISNQLSTNTIPEVRNNALMLLEFIKEFYMNETNATAFSTKLSEAEFFTLYNSQIGPFRKYKSSLLQPESKKIKQRDLAKSTSKEASINTMALAPSKVDPSIQEEFKDLDESRSWKENNIYIGDGDHSIITIIEAPCSSNKIIIRDITGKYMWFLSQQRILDFKNLRDIKFNGEEILRKSYIGFKENVHTKSDDEINELIDKIIAKGVENDVNIEEEVSKAQENDVLNKALNLLCKHSPDAMNVFLLYIFSLRIL